MNVKFKVRLLNNFSTTVLYSKSSIVYATFRRTDGLFKPILFCFSAASNGDHLTSNGAIFGVSPSRTRMSQLGIKATGHNNLVEERKIHGKSQRRGSSRT